MRTTQTRTCTHAHTHMHTQLGNGTEEKAFKKKVFQGSFERTSLNVLSVFSSFLRATDLFATRLGVDVLLLILNNHTTCSK